MCSGDNCSRLHFINSIGLGLGLQLSFRLGEGLGLGLGLSIVLGSSLEFG